MSYKVVNDFYHSRLGRTVKAGAAFPGGLDDAQIRKLVRAGCLSPLPAGDTLQPAPAPRAGKRGSGKREAGGDAGALFPGDDPAPVAESDDSGGGNRAKPRSGGRKRAESEGSSHDSGE